MNEGYSWPSNGPQAVPIDVMARNAETRRRYEREALGVTISRYLDQRPISPKDRAFSIVRQVAAEHNIPIADLLSNARLPHLVRARSVLYWRMRRQTHWSLPKIGRFCGGRDHTTVLYGLRAYAKRTGEAL